MKASLRWRSAGRVIAPKTNRPPIPTRGTAGRSKQGNAGKDQGALPQVSASAMSAEAGCQQQATQDHHHISSVGRAGLGCPLLHRFGGTATAAITRIGGFWTELPTAERYAGERDTGAVAHLTSVPSVRVSQKSRMTETPAPESREPRPWRCGMNDVRSTLASQQIEHRVDRM